MQISKTKRFIRWRSYVDLAGFLATASLKQEARKSVLSYAWWLIEPLSQLLLFYVAFGLIMTRSEDSIQYLAILFCGVVTWRWFTTGVMLGTTSLIRSAQFLRSFRLPTVLFVLSGFFESVVRIIPVFIVMLVYCIIRLTPIFETFLWVVAITMTLMALILAITTMMSWLVAYIPDLVSLIDICMRAGLFLSGVFFSIDSLPIGYQKILLLNPVAVIIDSYRLVLVHGAEPHIYRLILIFGTSIALAVINYYIHRKLYGRIPAILI